MLLKMLLKVQQLTLTYSMLRHGPALFTWVYKILHQYVIGIFQLAPEPLDLVAAVPELLDCWGDGQRGDT